MAAFGLGELCGGGVIVDPYSRPHLQPSGDIFMPAHAQTNTTATALIEELRKESCSPTGDVGGYAATAALRSLVEDWTTQDVQPQSLVSDMDDMLRVLANVRLRLAAAVTRDADRLSDFEDAQIWSQTVIDAIKAAEGLYAKSRN